MRLQFPEVSLAAMWQMSQQGPMRVFKMCGWWSRLVGWPQEGEMPLNLEYIFRGRTDKAR